MAKHNQEKLKLNLGCGRDYRPGWVNVDAVAEVEPDKVHDLLEPLPFADQSAEYVLAQDILEHFTKEDGQRVIAEISRVLQDGGVLEVRVPNVDAIIEQFADDPEVRNQFLYGTTEETGVFGAHKVGFTAQSLVTSMALHGLELAKISTEETNFHAFFRKSDLPQLKSVTVITQTLGMGGAEVFLTDLLVDLQKRGVKVKVHTTHKPWIEHLKQHTIDAQQIPVVLDLVGDWKGLVKSLLYFPYGLFYYGWLLWQERQTQLLINTSFTDKILTGWWSYFFEKPVVWFEFGPLQPLFKKWLYLPKVLYYSVKCVPQKVLVPSRNTHDRLITEAHVSLAKLQVIPCGRSIETGKSEKRKMGSKAQTIVCVSRLEPGKGQDLLIQAFDLVRQELPDIQLHIVGEGDFLQTLEKLVDEQGLEDHVHFLGRVPDQLQTIQQADVCVFPSVWPLEGFGLVMIEAMSQGKPLVGFDRAPTNEIIVNERNGLLAQAGDVDDLAQQILKLLKNEELAQQLGRQAQADFQENYAFDQLGDRYYKALLQAKLQWQAAHQEL